MFNHTVKNCFGENLFMLCLYESYMIGMKFAFSTETYFL